MDRDEAKRKLQVKFRGRRVSLGWVADRFNVPAGLLFETLDGTDDAEAAIAKIEEEMTQQEAADRIDEVDEVRHILGLDKG